MSCHSIYFEIALSDLDDGEGGGGGGCGGGRGRGCLSNYLADNFCNIFLNSIY